MSLRTERIWDCFALRFCALLSHSYSHLIITTTHDAPPFLHTWRTERASPSALLLVTKKTSVCVWLSCTLNSGCLLEWELNFILICTEIMIGKTPSTLISYYFQVLCLYLCEEASNQHTELLHCARKNNIQCCDFHSFSIVRPTMSQALLQAWNMAVSMEDGVPLTSGESYPLLCKPMYWLYQCPQEEDGWALRPSIKPDP